MPDCCFFHIGGGNELMACNDGELRAPRSIDTMVLIPAPELAKLQAERDDLHKHYETMCAQVERLLAGAWDVERLRAALEPTPEHVEALAQAIFAEQWNYTGEDGPNDEPMPTWEVVIFEGSAEGWRHAARAVLGFLSERAGIPPEAAHLDATKLSAAIKARVETLAFPRGFAAAVSRATGGEKPDDVRALIEAQANDEALWCESRSVEVAYLQQALRALHAAVEGTRA